jgi:endonuclease/exonuclease/phosphatase family metal-dependent hydrolase
VKLATYNVENLFARPRAFHRGDWAAGRPVLEAYGRTSALLEEQEYTDEIKQQIADGFRDLGLDRADQNRFVILRQNRSKLVRRSGGSLEIRAEGRSHWVGFLELRRQLASEACLRNTARVVSEVAPDVLAVVEADDRAALKRFGTEFVPDAPGPGSSFDHVMLIDGNDERGIDVGILTRPGFAVTDMRSHVDEIAITGSPLFSRDCAEYLVRTPKGSNLLLMVNHFKSKGFGRKADSDAKRLAQAARVAELYEKRRERYPFVAVVGDLNDTPDSEPLAPLFAAGLRDISTHPDHEDDGIPGTWGPGHASGKFDYLLLSPSLYGRVHGGGVFRRGVWDARKTPKWEMFDTVTGPVDAASDHAAVWADVNV